MKGKSGDKIKLIVDVSYGSIYGLLKVKKDTVLTIKKRSSSDDGIVAVEEVKLNGQLGKKSIPIEIWDRQYTIIG